MIQQCNNFFVAEKLYIAKKTNNFAAVNRMLLPTSYLPPISYMALLIRQQAATIEICETFPKQTHRNRCEILTSNGVMRLSVPVVRTVGNHTLTKDMEISYAERWNIQHIRAIESAYNNAPYFMYLWDGLKNILSQSHQRLIDLNGQIMDYLLQKLSIPCRLEYSGEYVSSQQSAADGQWMDMRDIFAHKAAQVVRLQLATRPYYQVWNDRYDFQPNLSIIDLLFNVGPAESRNYLAALGLTETPINVQ